MALITCPECCKEISSKASTCPNCGCPINNEKYKIIITDFNTDTSALAGIEETFHQGLSYDDGMKILNNLPYIVAEYDTQEEMEEYAHQLKSPRWGLVVDVESPDGRHLYVDNLNKVKCPSCESKNISRISVGERVLGIAMFGLLSNKRKKTFHCNSCGYEW